MKLLLDDFYSFLDRPLEKRSRAILLLLVIPLLLSFSQPLWNIHLSAPQYPKGLDLDIYSYKLEGGRGGKDIAEINTLNHYIGMRSITREQMTDLDWMPFAIGLLVILTLRVAAIGNVRMLIDTAVLTTYVSGFAFFRFVWMLYRYGHDLDPAAPFDVEPFTPVIIGVKELANFTTESYPRTGSYLIGAFVLGLTAILAWHLVTGRRNALGRSPAPKPPRPKRKGHSAEQVALAMPIE
jgi:copper chaperone NosL